MSIFGNAAQYDWATWMIGIMRSFISGGSSAMMAGMASMGIAPDRFNLNLGLGNTLRLMGIMFLFQGLYRLFEFLNLHGAPDKLQQKLDAAKAASQDTTAAIKDAQSSMPTTK